MNNEQRPVVNVDVDDVLADLLGSVIEFIKDHEGLVYERSRFNDSEFFRSINRIDLRHVWKTRIDEGGYVYGLRENDRAREAVDRLRTSFDVHPVTAPLYSCEKWMHERSKWLHDTMGFPYDDMIHTSAKHRVMGDVLVDDRVNNLLGFKRTNPHALLIVFDQPWNSNAIGPWVRARTMIEVADIIENEFSNKSIT